jgi:hypothetical protein
MWAPQASATVELLTRCDNPTTEPDEETAMSLYGGIDLHANNRVIVLLNEQDEVIYRKRLPNALPTILEQ